MCLNIARLGWVSTHYRYIF